MPAPGTSDAPLKVIDVDTHWCEPPDLWTSRAPAKYRDRVPHMKPVDNADGYHWFVEGDRDIGYALLSVIGPDGSKLAGFSHGSFEEIHPGGYAVKPRLAYMDEHGIWAQIVYPNAAGFSATKFMRMFEDRELYKLCLQIYNDAAAEFQAESGGRLLPMALLPVWNMEETLAEMRRCTEDLGLHGFAISDNLSAFGLPSYLDPYWDPFWEYADAARMPLNFHIGGSVIEPKQALWPEYLVKRPGDVGNFAAEGLAINVSVNGMTNGAIISNFLFSGIYDRYPNLKMVSVESGIGWIPYHLECLDYQWDEMIRPGIRRQERKPSDYWYDHWYGCFWFETFGPTTALEKVGVKNVLFETDYPHPTCLYPGDRDHLAELGKHWDEYTRRRVLQDNAAELYHIPV